MAASFTFILPAFAFIYLSNNIQKLSRTIDSILSMAGLSRLIYKMRIHGNYNYKPPCRSIIKLITFNNCIIRVVYRLIINIILFLLLCFNVDNLRLMWYVIKYCLHGLLLPMLTLSYLLILATTMIISLCLSLSLSLSLCMCLIMYWSISIIWLQYIFCAHLHVHVLSIRDFLCYAYVCVCVCVCDDCIFWAVGLSIGLILGGGNLRAGVPPESCTVCVCVCVTIFFFCRFGVANVFNEDKLQTVSERMDISLNFSLSLSFPPLVYFQ